VDFIGHRTFEEFKKDTGKLNELETYRQLTARAAQNGYRVNKVVYRGYGAPDRLQAMHDQAIEARTKLQLERATEEQSEQEIRRQADERQRQHLAVLKDMGVDLTALLTQGRADRVIELRGGKGVSPHLHLDGADGEGTS
jgi:hypothetical protein